MHPLDQPRFVVSVAAALAGMHPQTLRQYDRLGLVTPSRTAGRRRRYSSRDIERLREVQRLSQEEGINLAGIRRILSLSEQVRQLEELLESSGHRHRVFHAGASGETSIARRGARPQRLRGGALIVYRPSRVITVD